jgi:hypothetical protein
MELKLFGLKINVGLIILAAVIYLIMIVHLLCGCSRVGLMEGMEGFKQKYKQKYGYNDKKRPYSQQHSNRSHVNYNNQKYKNNISGYSTTKNPKNYSKTKQLTNARPLPGYDNKQTRQLPGQQAIKLSKQLDQHPAVKHSKQLASRNAVKQAWNHGAFKQSTQYAQPSPPPPVKLSFQYTPPPPPPPVKQSTQYTPPPPVKQSTQYTPPPPVKQSTQYTPPPPVKQSTQYTRPPPVKKSTQPYNSKKSRYNSKKSHYKEGFDQEDDEEGFEQEDYEEGFDQEDDEEGFDQEVDVPYEYTEGFSSSIFSDVPSAYTLGDYTEVNTSSWSNPNLVVSKGQPLSQGVQSILNRPKQHVPLVGGEMLLFNNNTFKPECCPSTYSNSQGCACITPDQYNYLIERGGNNDPYSEY